MTYLLEEKCDWALELEVGWTTSGTPSRKGCRQLTQDPFGLVGWAWGAPLGERK